MAKRKISNSAVVKPAITNARSRSRRLLALVLGGVMLAVAMIVVVWRPAAVVPAADLSRLNVLLVTLDTTRADHIGCYGYSRARTPRLDRLAKEGARFSQASSPAPITFTAHTSLFTGLYPFAHGARGNGDFYLADRFPTLATVLHQAGYRTAAFVSAFVLDHRYGLARGFDGYDDRMDAVADAHVVDVEAERRGDHTVAALSAWLDAQGAGPGVPFFAWLHLYDPHTPYDPPSPFKESFADAPYDGEIAFADSLVGSVLDSLGRLGLLGRTLVVVVGDHGESLGDHGEETHSMFVYESAIHVPLIVWKPGLVPAGAVVAGPVRLTDVAPTILDLLGRPGLASAAARSLVEDMRGRRVTPPPVYAETLAPEFMMNWAPLRSVRDERWKLIEAPRPELYDLEKDPGERVNLADAQPQTVRALTAVLARVAGTARGEMSRAEVDAETRDRLAALGYIGAGSGREADAALANRPDPKDYILVYNRLNAASRLARERRFDEALPILRGVLAADSRNAFAHLKIGDVYSETGEVSSAIREYRAYLNLVPPTAYVHHLIATCYLRLGQPKPALEEAAAALALDPRFSDARILRGSVFEERGQFDAALAEYRAAVGGDPANAMLRLDLAKVLTEMGRLDEARQEYETILRQQPKAPAALADLGALDLKEDKIEDALARLGRALALDPEQHEARFNLARAYERQGRKADATAEYRRLLENPRADADLRRAANARLRTLEQSR
jgi:arylsulfatase A-like enzyme/tetratricopeptide (TPR) repeat protein